jgi:hypothetical protein
LLKTWAIPRQDVAADRVRDMVIPGGAATLQDLHEPSGPARIIHEDSSRYRADGRHHGHPQGLEPEDARQNDPIRDRSSILTNNPG